MTLGCIIRGLTLHARQCDHTLNHAEPPAVLLARPTVVLHRGHTSPARAEGALAERQGQADLALVSLARLARVRTVQSELYATVK